MYGISNIRGMGLTRWSSTGRQPIAPVASIRGKKRNNNDEQTALRYTQTNQPKDYVYIYMFVSFFLYLCFIYLYVCMYVRTYVCMYVYDTVYVYICMCIITYTLIYRYHVTHDIPSMYWYVVYPGRICENHIFSSNCWHVKLWLMKLVAYSLGALETVPMGQVEGRGAAGEFSGCSLQKSDSKSSQKSEWTISSFSGNFNVQPSQDIPSVVLNKFRAESWT